jgi:hypothetical protein
VNLTASAYTDAREDYAGYCATCDDITSDSGVEPDAEGYKCQTCEGMTVMGIEQALLVGKVTIDGD